MTRQVVTSRDPERKLLQKVFYHFNVPRKIRINCSICSLEPSVDVKKKPNGRPTTFVHLLSPSIRLREFGISIFLTSGILSNQVGSTVDFIDPVAFNVAWLTKSIRTVIISFVLCNTYSVVDHSGVFETPFPVQMCAPKICDHTPHRPRILRDKSKMARQSLQDPVKRAKFGTCKRPFTSNGARLTATVIHALART